VMCLVLFAWMTRQDYFKSLTDSDVRTQIYENQIREIEDDLLQSVPKGEKLLEVLNSIIESIDEISSDVEALNIYLSKLNRSLMNHYHHGFAAEPTLPSFDVQKASMQMCQDQLRVAQSVTSVRAKLHMLAKNHLSPTGKNYINSRTVQVA